MVNNKNNNDKGKKEGVAKKSMSKETIRKLVDFAINQNLLVYRRLTDI